MSDKVEILLKIGRLFADRGKNVATKDNLTAPSTGAGVTGLIGVITAATQIHPGLETIEQHTIAAIAEIIVGAVSLYLTFKKRKAVEI